ncbi:MAG: hypothetical protein JXQ66_01610, partial [Campylobacterales bacterium]|nr:hypothetical protein [Campylobacterales bacterium]
MKKDILDRYEKDADGSVIVHISAQNIFEIYNYFDRASSFSKKDLNEELVTYIIECVNEIDSERFVLKFNFIDGIDDDGKEKVSKSIKSYFTYLQVLEKEQMHRQIKNAFILTILGFVFIFVSLSIESFKDKFFYEVLSEGVMVAGWVSLWEAIATFLIKWLPLT